MPTREPFSISLSITDFSPLFFDLEYLFKRLKATGIDGVEIVIGIKSRWNTKKLRELSEKYELPIISLHQPMWSGGGLWFDEGFFEFAKNLGVKRITCHPLLGLSFHHPRMQRYLAKLSHVQEKYGVDIFLENQPKDWLGIETDTSDLEKVLAIVKEYGFKMTLDIDHTKSREPHKEPWFPDILPVLGNIHLSSFRGNQKHLPVYLGELQTEAFINALHEADYQGLLTFELQYPRLTTFFTFDFEMVRKSVEVVKSV